MAESDNGDDQMVAICIKIDEFCINNDGLYAKNDELCIKNGDLNANGQELDGPEDDAGGVWRSVLQRAVPEGGAAGALEMQSVGIGEMLSAGWEMPHSRSGFDVIVTELVDCMGVLVQGVLDDLQLAIVRPHLLPSTLVF